MNLVTHKVIQVGNSLGVTLPLSFASSHKLKPGMKVYSQATDGEIKYVVKEPKTSTYCGISDNELLKLIRDVESRYGGVLEELSKLP